MKGKVKEKWGNLTDDDLDKIAGRRDQLEGKIQERYGSPTIRPKRTLILGTTLRRGETVGPNLQNRYPR